MAHTGLHIGIIMDGNRRYARKHGMVPWKGHEKGAELLDNLVEWCYDVGAVELTLYAFSTENFKREEDEKKALFHLAEKFFTEERIKKLIEHNISVNFLGRTTLFPKQTQDIMNATKEKTKNCNKFILNFCVGYGGRQELTDAAQELARDVKEGKINPEDITEKTFSNYLYTNHEPDFIIRTGGNLRTSNFLPWQSIYSEWFFIDTLFPEFSKEKLQECLDEFKTRQRRFGK